MPKLFNGQKADKRLQYTVIVHVYKFACRQCRGDVCLHSVYFSSQCSFLFQCLLCWCTCLAWKDGCWHSSGLSACVCISSITGLGRTAQHSEINKHHSYHWIQCFLTTSMFVYDRHTAEPHPVCNRRPDGTVRLQVQRLQSVPQRRLLRVRLPWWCCCIHCAAC